MLLIDAGSLLGGDGGGAIVAQPLTSNIVVANSKFLLKIKLNQLN